MEGRRRASLFLRNRRQFVQGFAQSTRWQLNAAARESGESGVAGSSPDHKRGCKPESALYLTLLETIIRLIGLSFYPCSKRRKFWRKCRVFYFLLPGRKARFASSETETDPHPHRDNNRRQDLRLLIATGLMLPYRGLLRWALVALVGNPLCPGREEHTTCETEVKLEISV